MSGTSAPILVVGSVAFDTVLTPFGEGKELVGGSATHFAVAASYFAPVRLVAVVGDDFTDAHLAPLLEREVDLEGLERVAGGKTFRWSGKYAENLNDRETLDTQLNVFATFDPKLPQAWASTPIVFLANIDPELQSRVLAQARAPRLVAADTMNFWISSKKEALQATLESVRLLFINDSEIRQLTERFNLVDAADAVHALGPEVVVVKRGEHGVLVSSSGDLFALPAFPVRKVVDPTGAGDAFAGGFLGHLAAQGERAEPDYRTAAVVGSVLASYQVESFSLDRIRHLDRREIHERYEAFVRLTHFAGQGAWSP